MKYNDIKLKKSVKPVWKTGTVGTSATEITVNPYMALRILNVSEEAGKILKFSTDGGTTYLRVPRLFDRTEIVNGETLHVQGSDSGVDYEIEVLERQ